MPIHDEVGIVEATASTVHVGKFWSNSLPHDVQEADN